MKASLSNYRQSPRKVRLLADLVRGKSASEALKTLAVTSKRASMTMIKLINSAVANAKNAGNLGADSLVITEVQVNKGVTLKRMMPRARGSGSRINKRSSHVILVLGEAPIKKISNKKTAKTKKAETK